jgi:hypothetical protein
MSEFSYSRAHEIRQVRRARRGRSMSSAQDRVTGPGASTPAPGQTGQPTQPDTAYQGVGYLAVPSSDLPAGQSGTTVLAATLMILSGLWSFFVGLTAILKQSFFVAQSNYTFQFSVHGWGWIHLVLGIVVLAAGACVLLGQTWAKALGIVLAAFSGLSYFLFLPYYPIWSVVMIGIDLFVIWALASSIGRHAAS